jgi:hypothetical protein
LEFTSHTIQAVKAVEQLKKPKGDKHHRGRRPAFPSLSLAANPGRMEVKMSKLTAYLMMGWRLFATTRGICRWEDIHVLVRQDL